MPQETVQASDSSKNSAKSRPPSVREKEFRYMDMSHTASLVLRIKELTHFIYELDKTTEDSDAMIKSWLM